MVSVVIVTYNGMSWIDKCLNSIQKDSAVSKIIIVDNGSSDGTYEHIKKSFPACRMIRSKRNLGFGQANNIGMKMALEEGTDYVFLLNQDAWIGDHAISKLVEIHHGHREYGLLSPIHLKGDGTAVDMKYGMFVMQSENNKLFSDLFFRREKMEDVYSVYFINAAAWLISRECLQTVGGFSPVFFHYGEDMGYAGRVLYHGFKIGICPASIIYHDRKNVVEYPDITKAEQYLIIKNNLHLIYLTDVHKSLTKRYLKLESEIIVDMFKWLFKGEFRFARISFKEWLAVSGIFGKVRKNMRIVKKKNGAYLLNNSSPPISNE